MKKRVVVTGMGVVTPIGNNVEDYWNSLKAGTCGIDFIKGFDTENYEVKIAAEVKNFDPSKYIDRKEAKRMDKFSQFAVVAAGEALEMAQITVTEENCEDIGVVVGCGIGGLGTIEEEHQKLLNKGPRFVSPMLIPKIIVNMAAGNISIKFGLKGISSCVVSACASATHSIGEAYRAIAFGSNKIILAGGTESSIVPLGIAGFQALTALSTSKDPMMASRPFDLNRDGFVMGEGAGILVLEELEHALARGAKIYAEIAGYGATTDAYHITSPSPGGEGAARAMRIAFEEGNIALEDLSLINAHGTSTPYNDKFETEAIKKAFGEHAYKVAINSTKSMTGHLLGAAGGIEAVACIKSIEEDFIHPTINLNHPDPECDLDYVPNVGRETVVKAALSNSLGFGGHNATLLFKKFER